VFTHKFKLLPSLENFEHFWWLVAEAVIVVVKGVVVIEGDLSFLLWSFCFTWTWTKLNRIPIFFKSRILEMKFNLFSQTFIDEK
jgi:hypothetical protein